jgi:hypothetical protein
MIGVPRHARVAVGLGAGLAALGLLFWLQPWAPTMHGPSGGPLRALGDPWSMGLDPNNSDRWTLGIYLCAADPASTPVLDSVSPVQTLGSFDFLGASLRQFVPSNSHPPILALDGYPPDVPDRIEVQRTTAWRWTARTHRRRLARRRSALSRRRS